jgi:hypothetical protein
VTSSFDALTKGTALLVPTFAQADYTQRMTLDGRVFTLHFTWNQREEAWYLALLDEADVEVISGVKIIANWPLLDFSKYDPRLPDGEFIAFDLTGNGSNPGYDDFGIGKRVELNYYSTT